MPPCPKSKRSAQKWLCLAVTGLLLACSISVVVASTRADGLNRINRLVFTAPSGYVATSKSVSIVNIDNNIHGIASAPIPNSLQDSGTPTNGAGIGRKAEGNSRKERAYLVALPSDFRTVGFDPLRHVRNWSIVNLYESLVFNLKSWRSPSVHNNGMRFDSLAFARWNDFSGYGEVNFAGASALYSQPSSLLQMESFSGSCQRAPRVLGHLLEILFGSLDSSINRTSTVGEAPGSFSLGIRGGYQLPNLFSSLTVILLHEADLNNNRHRVENGTERNYGSAQDQSFIVESGLFPSLENGHVLCTLGLLGGLLSAFVLVLTLTMFEGDLIQFVTYSTLWFLGAGGPHLGGKYNALIGIVCRENKEGAPLLAIFEKWGAVPPAAGWVNGRRVARDFRVLTEHTFQK
jgi:hypothetical protein